MSNSGEILFSPLIPNIPYQTPHLDINKKFSHIPFLSVIIGLMINLLTAIGLSPVGSSTVHIYKETGLSPGGSSTVHIYTQTGLTPGGSSTVHIYTQTGLTPGGSSTVHIDTQTGLTPGGSNTVHIYTQTIHRTKQLISLVGRLFWDSNPEWSN
jgi:hypothetical protein